MTKQAPPVLRRAAALIAPALLVLAGLAGCAGIPSQTPPEIAADVAAPAVAAPSSPPAPQADLTVLVDPLPAAQPPADMSPGNPTVPVANSRLHRFEDAQRTDLWVRVRAGFTMTDLDGELVSKWEQWYASRPDYVRRMTERGGRYLFHIVEEVERRGMPTELALLPFIESAFNPQALSSARAAGMWQFMPLTGKDFELKQNLFRDDRRDVLASTRAALDYLQLLHDQFDDWSLALAAYNWGQGNVQRAIRRNAKAGLPTDYASLRMPDETRNYVPKLQAVKNLVARPADFALVLPPLDNHPFFIGVTIERDIDVALAAQLAELPLDEFQLLNPQMNKPVILAAGTPQVLLPYDNANIFLRRIEAHRGPLASWTAWVAPKTLKLADAAKRVGMSESALREANRIPPRMLVKAGSTLLVRRGAHAPDDVAEHIADNAMIALAPESRPLRRHAFKAGRKGDSVVAVARRYRVSTAQVAQWNRVGTQAKFKPGQTVVVMLAPAPRRVAVRKGEAPRRAAKASAPARAKSPKR